MSNVLFETARLKVVPLTAPMIDAALNHRIVARQVFGAVLPPEWPLPDLAEHLPGLRKRLMEVPNSSQWGGVIVTKEGPTVVGDMGFHAGLEGEMKRHEVGYSVLEAFRNRGYASEALRGLLSWGATRLNATEVIGRCAKDNVASQRVLEKAGMTFFAKEATQEHGEVLVYKFEYTTHQDLRTS